jgi:hypothetical protein
MENIVKKYQKAKGKLETAKNEIESTMNNMKIPEKDRLNFKNAVINEMNEVVRDASGEMIVEAIEELADAHVDFKKGLEGNPLSSQVEKAAAVYGPQYAQLSDEELLRVLDKRFDNTAERGLALRYLQARADSKKQQTGGQNMPHVQDPLTTKINETINRNVDKLDGYAAEKYQQLQAARDGETFAKNAATALKLEVDMAKGELQGVNIIHRKDALSNIEKLKGKYSIETGTKSGRIPYSRYSS